MWLLGAGVACGPVAAVVLVGMGCMTSCPFGSCTRVIALIGVGG